MKRYSSKMLVLGALMIIFSLLLMFQPLFTWAQELNDGHPCRVALDPPEDLFELERMNPGDVETRTVEVHKTGTSAANLYLTWDWISGTPEPGEVGSLFEQLVLVIEEDGNELYRGPMVGGPQAGDPSAITDALYVTHLEYGDKIYLDISVILPGPDTGNEFQGSILETKLVFYTICDEVPDEIIEEPEEPAITPVPDEEEPTIIIIRPEKPRVAPPLPRTDGLSLPFLLIGIVLILAGLLVKKHSDREPTNKYY